MAAKYDLKKARGGEFVFNLKAANGQVVLTSERYKAKASANKGIESVRTNAKKERQFDRRRAKNGKPYFVLLAGNGEPIGRSQMYSSKAAMEKGVRCVKKDGPKARVDDLT
ncbi:MAG: YegP family protein [Acidimicrobiia bacterium]|nr:YegP family protein [Acidimicrobiia bacterium]